MLAYPRLGVELECGCFQKSDSKPFRERLESTFAKMFIAELPELPLNGNRSPLAWIVV
jgi:hypothetical protein